MLGDVIDGKYKIARKLGEGGMGAVYEAVHAGTGRRVAVKVITHRAAQNAATIARFDREARAAGAIDSEHIAQVLDSGNDPTSGLPYLVMEMLSGEDANQLLARLGPLPPELALRIAAQSCLGLQKAHAAQVVHRDIKPANIFLARRDEGAITVKILDFGIAKIKQEDGPPSGGSLTRTSAIVGSPLYMSPEQARGHKDIDFRTDVWSLGVVLYKLLTGRTPHEHVDAFGELVLRICSEPARPVQERAPWVPPQIAAIVHRALEIDRDDRFPRVAAMLDAIKGVLDGLQIHESMLVPLREADRAAVAPLLDLTDPGRGAPSGFGSAPALTSAASAETTKDRTAGPSVQEVSTASEASKQAASSASAARSRRVIAIAAGATLALAAAGAWFLSRPAPAAVAPAPTTPASIERAAPVTLDPERLASFAPLPAVVASEQNPLTEEKIKLGRLLFHDARLSANQDLSCSSCHPLDAYGMDGKKVSPGHAHRMGTRNAPSVYNAAAEFALLWDGRAASVEAQAEMPFVRSNEMAMTEPRVEATLRAIPEYSKAFARAFPGDKAPLSFANAARAIGAFERKLLTPGRWDKFLEGDTSALTEDEKTGFNDFVETGCVSCHFGPLVGGTMFQKVGLLKAWPNTMDRGRFEVTQKDVDYMVFRVPSLRNVAATAPYFHDGSVSSLDEAIRLMARHQLGKELPPAKAASIRTWLAVLTGEMPADYAAKPDLPPSGPGLPRPTPE
jgi:cytochrome c peroxidase/serine/threonine protein kinase